MEVPCTSPFRLVRILLYLSKVSSSTLSAYLASYSLARDIISNGRLHPTHPDFTDTLHNQALSLHQFDGYSTTIVYTLMHHPLYSDLIQGPAFRALMVALAGTSDTVSRIPFADAPFNPDAPIDERMPPPEVIADLRDNKNRLNSLRYGNPETGVVGYKGVLKEVRERLRMPPQPEESEA